MKLQQGPFTDGGKSAAHTVYATSYYAHDSGVRTCGLPGGMEAGQQAHGDAILLKAQHLDSAQGRKHTLHPLAPLSCCLKSVNQTRAV